MRFPAGSFHERDAIKASRTRAITGRMTRAISAAGPKKGEDMRVYGRNGANGVLMKERTMSGAGGKECCKVSIR